MTRKMLCVAGLIGVALLSLIQPLWAQDDFKPQRFRGFLESGEFAPAQRMVDQLPASPQRDGWLAEMAESQRAAGAFRQAGQTLGRIRSDQTYADAAQQFRNGLGNYQPPQGGRGGGIQADFDPLMELIQRTIEPESWEDLGGTGRMSPFEAGVHVDPRGTLSRVIAESKDRTLERLRGDFAKIAAGDLPANSTGLRMISLPRLERAVRQRHALGLQPTDAMRYLGGLRRIDYVFVYPTTGDLVIAGPAEAWRLDEAGRPVGVDSGQPILWLDDLVACWRAVTHGDGIFGCSIDPRAENLATTQAYLAESKATGKRWREGLQKSARSTRYYPARH